MLLIQGRSTNILILRYKELYIDAIFSILTHMLRA